VLKFITCERLFELHPTDHEGRLALRKDAVVSNVALARIGQQLQLQQRLTTPFQCVAKLQTDMTCDVVILIPDNVGDARSSMHIRTVTGQSWGPGRPAHPLERPSGRRNPP
jgi:Ribonuclease III domain